MTDRSENKENVAIPKQVPTTTFIPGNISTFTETDVSPTMPTAAPVQAKIGLPEIPEQNLNIMVDNMLQEEG